MEWLKEYYRNRFFEKKLNEHNPDLHFPLDLSVFKSIIILFSENSRHKGLVPLIKGKIQDIWPDIKVELLNTSKYTDEDKTWWGFLNEIVTSRIVRKSGALVISLLNEEDITGKYILCHIPAPLKIAISDDGPDALFCNLVVNIPDKTSTSEHMNSAEKIISTIKQLSR